MLLASAAFGRLFLVTWFLLFDATCAATFLSASGGRTAGSGECCPGDQAGDGQAGQILFQISFVHLVLLG